MRALQRLIHTHLLTNPIAKSPSAPPKSFSLFPSLRQFFTGIDQFADWSSNFGDSASTDQFDWDAEPSLWSAGLTEEHFDGGIVGRQIAPDPIRSSTGFGSARWTDEEINMVKNLKKKKNLPNGWDEKMRKRNVSTKQVRELRGSYLKDSEKTEMYKKHKKNPNVYTVENLAKEYRIMRQRVHAILWLKELEEEEEKKLGRPLDDSIEVFLDTCPEFFNSHDKEFQVASIPHKPDFEVMPKGWDGTTDEAEMLYQDFVQRFNSNKTKMSQKVKCHKYNRRNSAEKLGPPRKHGNVGQQKFGNILDGSSCPLDDKKKIFVKRKYPRRRRKILL